MSASKIIPRSEQWRARAVEMRRYAETADDAKLRDMLLEAAWGYDLLADREKDEADGGH